MLNNPTEGIPSCETDSCSTDQHIHLFMGTRMLTSEFTEPTKSKAVYNISSFIALLRREIIIHSFTHSSIVLQPFVEPWPQFRIFFYIDGRTS
jgi:hypothetical protein